MPASSLVIIGVLAPTAGVIGALAWPYVLQRSRVKWSNHQVLIVLVIAASVVPAYGCLGFVWQGGGMKTPGEMYVLAFFFGGFFSRAEMDGGC